MNPQVQSEKFLYSNCAYEGKITAEETVEMIVPDALPDISNILETKAICYLKGKDSDKGSVTISASAAGSVIFLSDEDEHIHKIDFNVPVEFSESCPDITNDSKIIADVSIKSVETSMINPRKITVRVFCTATVECFNNGEIEISTDADCAETEAKILKSEESVRVFSEISEKMYVISDEIRLPAGKPKIDEILFSDIKIVHDDVKSVGTKVIVNGTVLGDIIYSSFDDGRLNCLRTETKFSQIIEMNRTCESSSFFIKSAVTGIYLNSDLIAASNEKTVNLEVHIVSQCACATDKTMSVLCDVYSPKYKLDVKNKVCQIPAISEPEEAEDSAKVSVKTEDIAEVVLSYVSLSSVIAENDGGMLSLTASGTVHVLYNSQDGKCMHSMEYFKQKTVTNIEFTKYANISYIPDINTSCAIGQGTVEVKLAITYKIIGRSTKNVSMILEAEYNEEEAVDLSAIPSIIIKKTEKGDNLWELSKNYHSDDALILSINNCETAEELFAKKYILLPKYIYNAL